MSVDFWRIPNDPRLATLSMGAKFTFGVIFTFQGKNTNAWPSHATIASAMGCSHRSVGNYIEELVTNGLIEKRRLGFTRTNRYRVIGRFCQSGEAKNADHRQADFANLSNRTGEKEQSNSNLLSFEEQEYGFKRTC